MKNTITAVFERNEDAYDAIRELERLGISPDRVSAVMTDKTRGKGFSLEQGNKAAEGAAVGGSLTGLAAAIVGGLAAVGAVAVPGVNLVASGPIIAALAAGGAGAATGGVLGALVGSGIPENEAKVYENAVTKGAILLAVEARDKEEQKAITSIFRSHEAVKVAA